MDLSLQQLKKDLKEMQQERDKAVHELSRLKQHLLEKVSCLNQTCGLDISHYYGYLLTSKVACCDISSEIHVYQAYDLYSLSIPYRH